MDLYSAAQLYKKLQPTDEKVNEQHAQGKAAERSGVATLIFGLGLLVFMAGSAYLSWTSNTMIDKYLVRAGDAVPAGNFINVCKALATSSHPFGYMIYYFGFKKHRVDALNKFLMPVMAEAKMNMNML